MKRNYVATLLLTLALLDATTATVFWLIKGANTGWTRTQVEVVTLDEVTGLEARNWENKFVPGVELLGTCLLGAGAMATVALLFRKQETRNTQS